MKKINTYLFEKFKISKNIKQEENKILLFLSKPGRSDEMWAEYFDKYSDAKASYAIENNIFWDGYYGDLTSLKEIEKIIMSGHKNNNTDWDSINKICKENNIQRWINIKEEDVK